MMTQKSQLPIVDIGCLFEPSRSDDDSRQRRRKAGEALLKAFQSPGMAYLWFGQGSRHILEPAIRPAFEEADQFFKRPLPEKQATTALNLPLGVTRGYLGTGAESGATSFEWKEAFSWSYDWDRSSSRPENGLEHENVWPSSPSEPSTTDEDMKTRFGALFTFMGEVTALLVDALLDAWPSSFGAAPDLRSLSKCGETISLVRAFHYFDTSDADPGMTGSCEHTDWGFATLIAQQDSGGTGLQVCVDGSWVDVAPVEDTLIVNCSDFLSLLTDGRLHSPLHRVVLTQTERTSFVYFHYPGFDTPVPSVSEAGRERTKGLYLLKNQSEDERSRGTEKKLPDNLTFGELIAQKWEQVTRS